MALVSVMSAKGAPGATTTAMLLATLWPTDSLLVDADPLGGDVALRLLGDLGHPLNPDRGLMSLLPLARRGMVPEQILHHAQAAVGGQPVLCGLAGPEQSQAIAPLWPVLADAFAQVPATDVIADIGQLNSRSAQLPLLEASRALIVVYRPTAWSAVHTRRRLESLASLVRDSGTGTGGTGTGGTVVGIVGVCAHRDLAHQAVTAYSIRDGLGWVNDYGVVTRDNKAVRMFEGGVVHRPERTLLARSGRTVVEQLYADIQPLLGDPGTAATSLTADGPRNGGSRREGDT
jgi:hypothetical protein